MDGAFSHCCSATFYSGNIRSRKVFINGKFYDQPNRQPNGLPVKPGRVVAQYRRGHSPLPDISFNGKKIYERVSDIDIFTFFVDKRCCMKITSTTW